MIQLSVIVVSCRPRWLASCLRQIQRQSLGNLRIETIVICEDHHEEFRKVANFYSPDKVRFQPRERGNSGAESKDEAIDIASGEYLCFWDDDNVYYDHALASLYSSVCGYDIAFVGCHFMTWDFQTIPSRPEISFGNLDTMCLCVRKSLAIQEKWSEHIGAGTDFHWVRKLMNHNPRYRFVDISIGEHLR